MCLLISDAGRRGELYFELHRGTYTSHAINKSCNRQCELLLREVEAAASAAVLATHGAYSYPRQGECIATHRLRILPQSVPPL